MPLNPSSTALYSLIAVGVVLLLVGNLAEIELRGAGQVVQRIVVHHVLKLALRHLVPSGGEVTHPGLQSLLQRRRLLSACWARRCSARHAWSRTCPP